MAEQLIHPAEKGEKLTHTPEVTHHPERTHRHETEPDHGEKPKPIHELQKAVQEKAVSREQMTIVEQQREPGPPVFGVQRQLKSQAYQQTLHKVRTRLSPTQKAFSKVIHQPTVEAASNMGAQTVARPSGVLGGGIVALVGSGFLLYMSKHYGFRYNFFVYILLLVVGFIVGLVGELAIRLLVRKRI